MTVERRIVVGLEDVQAICFECLKKGCGYKVSISPDAFERIPETCAQCGARWVPLNSSGVSVAKPWVFYSFANSLKTIRNLMQSGTPMEFRVLVEFHEPKTN